jgi:hypothetical protein
MAKALDKAKVLQTWRELENCKAKLAEYRKNLPETPRIDTQIKNELEIIVEKYLLHFAERLQNVEIDMLKKLLSARLFEVLDEQTEKFLCQK